MAGKSSGPNFFGNLPLVAAVLLIGTYFISGANLPIQGSRPASAARPAYSVEQLQNIDARLWQDPFAAIWKDIAAHPVPVEDCTANAKSEHPHSCPPVSPNENVLVLGVMLPGGPYQEAEESRRQVRYAVLSGLNAKGYVPVDEEHIGYYRQPLSALSTDSLRPLAVADWGPLRTDIAFEKLSRGSDQALVLWVSQDELVKATNNYPLRGLSQIKSTLLVSADKRGPRIVFLGPWGSSTLKRMVEEAPCFGLPDSACESKASATSDSPKTAAELTLYNFSATADQDFLLPGSNLPSYFGRYGIAYNRTIANDSAVAQIIADELATRGIDPAKNPHDHVLLISEWDSFYGQSLPQSMQKAFFGPGEATSLRSDCAGQASQKRLRPQLFCVSYMRGLDGQLADAPANGSGQQAGNRTDDAASGQTRNDPFLAGLGLSRGIERPYGNGQYDYLRRLADRIALLDEKLRNDGEGKINAIGVVGSDVYDKLAVLQILRPQFPESLFFTTDLDARLYHPAELAHTRNLIVASAYGLELNDELQGHIPPFRIAYQTSAFLTTRLILEDQDPSSIHGAAAPLQWANRPQLFEIGLLRPFAFVLPTRPRPPNPHPRADNCSGPCSPAPQPVSQLMPTRERFSSLFAWPALAAENPKPPEDACLSNLRGCASVTPPTPKNYPEIPWPAAAGTSGEFLWALATQLLPYATLAGALMLGFGLLVSPYLRDSFTGEHTSGAKTRELGNPLLLLLVFLLAGMAFCLSWPAIAGFLTDDGAGEPIILLSGISLWPSIVIRIGTIFLCYRLIRRSVRQLDANFNAIEIDFHLGKGDRVIHHGWGKRIAHLWGRRTALASHLSDVGRSGSLRRLTTMFSYCVCEHKDLSRNGNAYPIEKFWAKYISKARTSVRFCRVTVATAAVLLLYLVLYGIFGNPQPATRSATLQWINGGLSWIEVAVTWFLILFVVDATLYCVRFVSELRNFPSEWPESTLKRYEPKFNLNGKYLNDWIDLQFIATRTKCINKLVYYPSIVLALIVVSRSSLFGYFPHNWPMLIMAALGFLIVVGCALLLQHEAEAERDTAIGNLSEHLIAIRGRAAEPTKNPVPESAARPRPEDARPEQLAALVQRVEQLSKGAFTPFSQQPVVRALALPLSGIGGTALLNYLPFIGL